MTHLDDDELIRFSFGEGAPDATQRKHLQSCARCDAELGALNRVISVGRSSDGVDLLDPPDSVWEAIHSELGLPVELRSAPREYRPPSAAGGPASRHVPSPGRRRSVGQVGRRRRIAVALLTVAALVVGAVAGIIGTAVLSRPDDPRLVAEAELEPFPTWEASGSARVEQDATGARRLLIDVSAPGKGFSEVWLIDPDTSGLVSLGLLSGATGSFALPEDIDLTRYSVVDISREPNDGDPAHSGNSIVRGPLRGS
jgi:hypothetical protein